MLKILLVLSQRTTILWCCHRKVRQTLTNFYVLSNYNLGKCFFISKPMFKTLLLLSQRTTICGVTMVVCLKADVRMNNFHTASECGNPALHDYFMKSIILIPSICCLTDYNNCQMADEATVFYLLFYKSADPNFSKIRLKIKVWKFYLYNFLLLLASKIF